AHAFMPTDEEINMLARVARTKHVAGDDDSDTSILLLAAASYSARPKEDATVPTGFDPVAVALFEAIVEAAYLVASADGVVDAEERKTFERVVFAACGGAVAASQVSALVGDFEGLLEEDGLDARVAAIAKLVSKPKHAVEVLRIAALIAQTTEGVADSERNVLEKIAKACGLDAKQVDVALSEVKTALAAAP
ncbi:MAG: tellurite resistance TerB family protein, partial [Polyangiaceae bacterium]